MKAAIFGANGQLGLALTRRGAAAGFAIRGFPRAEVDLTDKPAVEAAIAAAAPDVVINAAAYTAVDRAEQEPERATAVNRDGPANLALACGRRGIPLIHLSTDYVFDGGKTTAWTEEDVTNPLGVYGASKLAGEVAVRRLAHRHVIMRTAWVYSADGNNFVKTMLRLGRERQVLRVVTDQRGTPTAASDLADAVLQVAHRQVAEVAAPSGTYHFAGRADDPERGISWYEFACAIFSEAAPLGGPAPRLEPTTSAEFPTAARRPANSVLACAKITRDYGISPPHWRDALAKVVMELL